MMRTLPDKCMRGRVQCQPLHLIASDDDETFVCCGLHTKKGQDPFRHCFKSEETDTMLDYDRFDMLDTIEVMTRALSTFDRIKRKGQNDPRNGRAR